MIKSIRTDIVTTYKSIRNLSDCVEKSGELRWVVGCSLGGERWDGKEEGEEEGETKEESVGRGGTYIMAFIDGITDEHVSSVITVGDSIGEIATSLYGYLRLNSLVIPSVNPSVKVYDYLSLNPSVMPSLTSSKKTPRHHTAATFQTNCIGRRRYGRYSPTKTCRR
jgi:hypothetical protein